MPCGSHNIRDSNPFLSCLFLALSPGRVQGIATNAVVDKVSQ